jgi:hypothetical protein
LKPTLTANEGGLKNTLAKNETTISANKTSKYCELMFTDGEKINLHHIDWYHNNWKVKNLLAVHESSHYYIHMQQRKT